MSSILNNAAALSALQSLQMTQASLSNVQNEVSTGLSVANASDNSSYWSIAQQLDSDSSVVTASQSALSEGQSVLSTATSALNSVITTLNSMATQLTQAQNPGAVLTDINTALASLGSQLTDAVNGASFNGLNVLNGSQTAMNFVSGFNSSATGGSVNTVNFTAQALNSAAGQASTTSTINTTTAAGAALLAALPTAAAYAPAVSGTPQVYTGGSTSSPDTMTVVSVDAEGRTTTTVYTAENAAGQALKTGNFLTDVSGGAVKNLGVTTTVTPASVQNTSNSIVTSATQITALQALTAAGAAPSVGSNQVIQSSGNGTVARMVVNSVDAEGNLTSTTYTALNAAGTAISYAGGSTWGTLAGVASLAVSTTVSPAATTTTTTTSTSTVTDASTVASLQSLFATPGTNAQLSYGKNVNTITDGVAGATSDTLTVQSMDSNGDITTTTYTPLDANGSVLTGSNFANAVSLSATSTTVWAQSGLLRQNGTDLTTLGTSTGDGTTITADNASTVLTAVNNALAAVQNYSGLIGATQDRLTAASTFNSALTTDYSNGVAGLVDADMNTASTQLQALQTQEQLGIQSLSIANQNSQLILKLFQ